MYEAIFVRKSVKKFIMEEIEKTTLDQIEKFANELPHLIEDTSIEFEIVNHLNYGKHVGKIFSIKAPYYFIIGSDDSEESLLEAGYLMEQMMLYMTSRGLGTCYLTHVERTVDEIHQLKKKPILGIGFGKTQENMYRDSRKSHRLPEKEIALYKSEVSSDIKLMIKAARVAPSYMNSQPWRMVVYDNRIHIFARKNVFIGDVKPERKWPDIGIMTANILLVAEELWIDVSVERVENISNKYFKNNDYIFSVIIK